MNNKILILTGGPKKKISGFVEPAQRLGMDVAISSFYDISFNSAQKSAANLQINVGGHDLKEYRLIYFRVVGKRIEDATLVVNYSRENGIKIVDGVYLESILMPSTISKAMEMKKLIDAGVPMPKTLYADIKTIRSVAPREFNYPFVLKSTSGRKARDAWLIIDETKMNEVLDSLIVREREGVHFFAQSAVASIERVRVLVVGGEVVGSIVRPTKWGKTFSDGGKVARRGKLDNPDKKIIDLALKATEAVGLDIAGVDILQNIDGSDPVVIEVNAAPAWKLIAKDCGISVEEKILKFLQKQLN